MTRALLLVVATLVSVVSGGPTVNTSLGVIEGVLEHGYRGFYGIRFAKPPVGNLRWEAPQPSGSWEPGILKATTFGNGCIGASNRWGILDLNYTEDCLFLNVWTPPEEVVAAKPVPVMVWIYGGGFFLGAGSDLVFRGGVYANRTNHPVVLVTFNYRLGALGWMATDRGDGLAGNYGLQDQQLALKWVRDHIASFGGDPLRVTIFGQSAGGMSVLTHLVSPASTGLFSAAIASSPIGLHYRSVAENAPLAATMAHRIGCRDGDVACMRKVPGETIGKKDLVPEYLFHLLDGGAGINFLPWMPTSGTPLLPAQHIDLINEGRFAKVPLIIGTVRNETAAWVPAINSTLLYNGVVRMQFPAIAEKVLAFYDAKGGSPYEKTNAALTDFLATCYVRRTADAIAARKEAGAPVFLYQFMHVPTAGADPLNAKKKGCHVGADGIGGDVCHAADNTFVFHSAQMVDAEGFSPLEEELSMHLRDAWASFAYSAGAPPVPGWGAFNRSSLPSLQWGAAPAPSSASFTHAFRRDACDFWDRV